MPCKAPRVGALRSAAEDRSPPRLGRETRRHSLIRKFSKELSRKVRNRPRWGSANLRRPERKSSHHGQFPQYSTVMATRETPATALVGSPSHAATVALMKWLYSGAML